MSQKGHTFYLLLHPSPLKVFYLNNLFKKSLGQSMSMFFLLKMVGWKKNLGFTSHRWPLLQLLNSAVVIMKIAIYNEQVHWVVFHKTEFIKQFYLWATSDMWVIVFKFLF